jgi:bifunctional UDP-N-acetylglucosamine pyrophosphorylase/glucosamine-1-phosphate N-acetyltransferase
MINILINQIKSDIICGERGRMMLTGIILAAGKGKRMKSKYPKVIHKVADKEMINHVIDAIDEVNCNDINIVVGHGKDIVKKTICRKVNFITQEEQLGTGHAVMVCDEFIPDDGNVLILYGDTPLLTGKTLKEFVNYHNNKNNSITVLTALFDNPFGYGRIVKDKSGNVVKIIEQNDATEKEKMIKEINSGIYCVQSKLLKESLKKLSNNNNQNEYYLTDIVEILKNDNEKIGSFIIENKEEIIGVNSRKQLLEVENILKRRTFNKHMENGVSIVDSSIYIGKDVKIGIDTVILPGAYIIGNTEIGEDCIIGPNCRIENCIIKNNVEIRDSTIISSEIDNNSKIGPYAYLRPNSKIGKDVKIGDFVEVKNSVVGNGSKVSHLSYIGDGEIGENVNIGCGVVFVNYNGKDKNRTIVKNNAFIGCNSNLIAPVVIEENAYVAAGSTITEVVPSRALAIARMKQLNKLGWVTNNKNLLKK